MDGASFASMRRSMLTTLDAASHDVGETAPKRRRDKLRSAWISFAGRIVAQIIGAAATVVLSLMLVQHYVVPGIAQRTAHHGPDLAPAVPAPLRASRDMALAVLPLLTFSDDPQHDDVADGMTDRLITELAQIEGLHVISRTSSMHYKDQRRRLPDIARELNVSLVVEGSVVLASNRVRITAQLIDAGTDERVWSHSYEGAVQDAFSRQAIVARAIAGEVLGRAASRNRSHEAIRGPVEATRKFETEPEGPQRP